MLSNTMRRQDLVPIVALMLFPQLSHFTHTTRTGVNSVVSIAWQDSIRIHERAQFELTGDDYLETVTVTAVGVDWRSLHVRIEITEQSGKVHYKNEWESSSYFNYPPGWSGLSPEEREKAVRGAIAAIVGDQQAFQADMVRRGHRIYSDEAMRRAVEWDLIEQRFPNLRDGVDDPREYSQRLREARQALPQERVTALLAELKDQPKFIYRAWGEAYYGLAWSPNEDRFVRIYMGG